MQSRTTPSEYALLTAVCAIIIIAVLVQMGVGQ